MYRFVNRTLLLILLFACAGACARTSAGPLKFRITVSKSIASGTISGRLFVLMSNDAKPQTRLEVGFIPGATWLAAVEIEALHGGESIEFDPDRLAYPRAFSQAPVDNYQFMALLDQDHSFAYYSQDAGDLYSKVVAVAKLDPANAGTVELTLDQVTPVRPKPADTENIKLIEYKSELLSQFWGRPIIMRAGVVLPPAYATSAGSIPTAYMVHGFGGDHTSAWRSGPNLVRRMASGEMPKLVVVYLDGSCPTGHHEFADSVNNGPWGQALTKEFIPFLESRFKLLAQPGARFLSGHSSGGWSTLWLQVNYPDFFGGTWSTSPDPVDLRNFTGIDMTPGSTDNAYRKADGTPKNLVRLHGQELATVQQFAQQEVVQGEYGGQFESFEWVWSPRGENGRPLQAFNRVTGELDQTVLAYWQRYDIRRLLQDNWSILEPRLRGKLHVIVGAADTFHLEEAVVRLCEFLKQKRSDAVCELVPERDHFDLYAPYSTYPKGLDVRIAEEMQAQFVVNQKRVLAGQ